MERKRTLMILLVCLLLFLGLAVFSAVVDERYMLVSLGVLFVCIAPFFVKYERKDLHAREIVLIAMLIAIAAVSRIPFAAIPSVQPTSFVIIISALVFGAESGFMIGAMAALVSNMFLGQGPWTPWQMLSWGLIGLTAGMMKDTVWMRTWLRSSLEKWRPRKPRVWQQVWQQKQGVILLAFGFIWGFVFGWIMNLTLVITLFQSVFTWKALLAIYAASFYFDLMHALSNVFFIAVFGAGWIRIMERFKKKYGLL